MDSVFFLEPLPGNPQIVFRFRLRSSRKFLAFGRQLPIGFAPVSDFQGGPQSAKVFPTVDPAAQEFLGEKPRETHQKKPTEPTVYLPRL